MTPKPASNAGASIRLWAGHAPASRRIAASRCGSPPTTSEATIFSGTCDGRLVAIDPAVGRLREAFGAAGVLDLRPGVDAREGEQYGMTSAPAIYRDLVIVGALAPEGASRGPAGDVRAFDVRTGQERWRFHTVPRPGEPGHDTWSADAWQRRTGVNVWTSMSVDEARGLVFLPLGSASYDFYGGDRPGANLYANSLVALDAATGVRRWHQQIVHHDIWDYDLPAQPILVDVTRAGRTIPVVVQLTKMGLVFVFDRVTGEPVFGIEERPVPQSDVPGEKTWPTQPFPVKPPPLSRIAALTRGELTTVTPESRQQCEAMFDKARSGGLYTAPGREATFWYPGTMGGATWSGGAADPARGLLFVNTNDVGAVGLMKEQPPGAPLAYRRSSPWGEYARFWDSSNLPCQQPPWGRLHAVDLVTGDIRWQVPLGNAPQLAARGITGTGTPNIGGAIATASGLVFIAATNDARLRAFDAVLGPRRVRRRVAGQRTCHADHLPRPALAAGSWWSSPPAGAGSSRRRSQIQSSRSVSRNRQSSICNRQFLHTSPLRSRWRLRRSAAGAPGRRTPCDRPAGQRRHARPHRRRRDHPVAVRRQRVSLPRVARRLRRAAGVDGQRT